MAAAGQVESNRTCIRILQGFGVMGARGSDGMQESAEYALRTVEGDEKDRAEVVIDVKNESIMQSN